MANTTQKMNEEFVESVCRVDKDEKVRLILYLIKLLNVKLIIVKIYNWENVVE